MIGTKDIIVADFPKQVLNIGFRKAIYLIEAKIMAMPESLGEDPFPLEHSFAEGLYIRTITIPKGYLVVGKLHKQSYINFITKGDMTVLTEAGPKRVKGPCTIVSPPGTKRFGYSHEEVVWTTVHGNPKNERDIDKLEKMIHAKNYSDLSDGIIDVNAECVELIEFVDTVKEIDKKLIPKPKGGKVCLVS